MHFISVLFIAVIGVPVAQFAATNNTDQYSVQTGLNADTKVVTGGTVVTDRKEYPYHASVQLAATNAHRCSASLIDEQNLLTSASCMITTDSSGIVLMEADTLQVVLGTLELGQTTGAVTKKLKYIFVHEDYDILYRSNDIAVIRIAEKIDEYSDNVKSVSISTAYPGTGAECTSSGWAFGANSQVNEELKKVTFSILDKSSCSIELNDDEFCGDNPDDCEGEMGSPVICNNLQVGIVSASTCFSTTGDTFTAGPIINVVNYKEWIEEQQKRSGSSSLFNSIYVLSFCICTWLYTYKNL